MHQRRFLIGLAALLWLGALPAPAWAAGRVELELVTEQGAPLTAQQEWLRRLAQAGVSNVRIRSRRAVDQAGIAVRGTESAPIYTVTGVITSAGDVLLPGARYRPGDVGRLARWLDDLAKMGPPDQRPQKSAFGLTAEQFDQLHKDLARPVGFPTKALRRRDVVQKIGSRLAMPLRMGPEVVRAMPDEDVLGEDLSTLSCGTALACAVRPLGMCLVPREAGAGRMECVVVKAGPNLEAWPVGWKPEKRPLDVLPALYEFLPVNLQGVTVTQLLDAVAQRLKVPILLDHNAMARYGVEPGKSTVTLPQRRTSYTLLLRRALNQAGLTSELRVDEAGKPFLWITTIKPL
jgi:hypothetical protein